MKKLLALVLAAVLLFSFAACTNNSNDNQGGNNTLSIADAKSLADLKGMKIAAQAGTFHEQALTQIEEVKSSIYPDFTTLLTALKSGAVDGYIAEEPTALSVALSDDTFTYLSLKNNDTGFTASKEDTGIAIATKKGNELRDQIDAVLSEISEETKSALMEQIVKMTAGEEVTELALQSETPAETTGTLKVAMECAYEPFNWTETGAKTLGCVPISGEGKDDLYANGYDVQVAQYVANKLGLKLEVYSLDWDSLIPALNAGTVDAVVAGMSPTAERAQQVDFTQTYYESNLVIIIKK